MNAKYTIWMQNIQYECKIYNMNAKYTIWSWLRKTSHGKKFTETKAPEEASINVGKITVQIVFYDLHFIPLLTWYMDSKP
jgi:hypothetical protein